MIPKKLNDSWNINDIYSVREIESLYYEVTQM